MRRESRTLVVLAVMALLGVVALATMAQRYSSILARRDPAEGLSRVDGFVEVRRAMVATIRQIEDGVERGGPPVTVGALRRARQGALGAHRVDPLEYARTREAYRAWRSGRGGGALDAALEQRRDALAELDLGPYETLDR